MKNFKPLYLQNLTISVPGLRVRRLELNRHWRELDAIAPHKHDFDQALVYLAGRGVQIVSGHSVPVRAGSVVFLPRGRAHAFRETAGRRPLCLALDFTLTVSGAKKICAGQLTQPLMLKLRQQLSALMLHARADAAANQLTVSGLILQILDLALKAAGVLPSARASAAEPPLLQRARRVLADPANSELRLAQAAVKIGCQLDHLNRQLRHQCGLTLGQLRNQELTARAKRLLRQSATVSDAAERLGFSDQNYFARWFRAHTGMTPSAWRNDNETRRNAG